MVGMIHTSAASWRCLLRAQVGSSIPGNEKNLFSKAEKLKNGQCLAWGTLSTSAAASCFGECEVEVGKGNRFDCESIVSCRKPSFWRPWEEQQTGSAVETVVEWGEKGAGGNWMASEDKGLLHLADVTRHWRLPGRASPLARWIMEFSSPWLKNMCF